MSGRQKCLGWDSNAIYSRVSNNCRAYNYYFSKFFQGLQSYLGAYIYWFLAFFQSLRLYIFVVEVFWWKWNENWIRKVAILSNFEINQLALSMPIFIKVFSSFFILFRRSYASCVSIFSRVYNYLRANIYCFGSFIQGIHLFEGLCLLETPEYF